MTQLELKTNIEVVSINRSNIFAVFSKIFNFLVQEIDNDVVSWMMDTVKDTRTNFETINKVVGQLITSLKGKLD